MYKAVIFDFFGVLCTSIATSWFKKNVPEYQTKLQDFQDLCTRSDLGMLSRADFNTAVSELSGIPVAEIRRGIEAETGIDTELVAYAKALKAKGYRIACLSNGTSEWTLQVINEQGLGELFEEIVLSGDLGIRKPDPQIYDYTLGKLKLDASQVVFVDDRKENTDAAEGCGIRSLVFTDTSAFIRDFEQLAD